MKVRLFLEKLYWHLFKFMPCEMILKKKWNAYYKFRETSKTFNLESIGTPMNIKTDKNIWFYWEQGIENAPAIVKKCYESVVRNKPDGWDIVVLNKKSAKEYISMPPFIEELYEHGKIWKALYADLLRLALLYKYGGIWNDATCYVTKQIPEEILNNPLFFFRIEAMMPCYPLAFENWYIRAEKENYVIGRILENLLCYWETKPNKQEYFNWFYIQYSIYMTDKRAKMLLDEMWYCNNYDAMLIQIKYGYGFVCSEKIWKWITKKCFVQKLTYKYENSLEQASEFNLLNRLLNN